MRIVEFRFIIPGTLEKYDIGLNYTTNKRSRDETGSGEGIEYLKNEPYDDGTEKGQYTHKVLHFSKRVPKVIRWALPKKYLSMQEYSKNAYPHFFTEYQFLDRQDWFNLIVESRHIEYKNGMEIPDNLMNLSKKELEKRHVFYPDILNGKPKACKEYDLHDFIAPSAGIDHPLEAPKKRVDESRPPEWTEHFTGPMIMAVKTIRMKFEWKGIKTITEKYVCDTVFHDVFLDNHRAIIKWIDTWWNLTIDDIRKIEDDIMEEQKNIEFENPELEPEEEHEEREEEDEKRSSDSS